MRKLLALLMILLLPLSLPACSLMPGSQQLQQNEGQTDSGSEDTSDDDDSSGDNSGGSLSVGTNWPEDLELMPEFTYGRIINVFTINDTYEGINFTDYQISFEAADPDSAANYAADLEKAGFELVYEPYEWEDSDINYIQYEYEMYAFETADTLYYVSVDLWMGSDETGGIYISTPEIPASGSAQSGSDPGTSDGYDVEYDDGESELNWGTLSENDIPDGYPESEVPLFGLERGELLGASRQDMGESGTAFIIIFGINEDMETISAMIAGQLEQHVISNGGSYQSVMDQMFMGDINGCSYTVAIGDGSADGYTTVVDYTVICS